MTRKKKYNSKTHVAINRGVLATILILSLALALISTSLFFDFRTLDIYEPFYKSNFVEGAEIVYFPEEFENILESRYKSDLEEYIYCLYGDSDSEGYLITDMRETLVTESNTSALRYVPCTKYRDYLGTIHSHPRGAYGTPLCILSEPDKESFLQSDSAISGVICGTTGDSAIMRFYGYDAMDYPLNTVVITE